MTEHETAQAAAAEVNEIIASAAGGTDDHPQIAPLEDDTITLDYGVEIDGKRHRIVRARELKGLDEEMMGRIDVEAPDYLVRLVDTVVARCTTFIGVPETTPRLDAYKQALLVGDREHIFLTVMRLTYGNEREYRNTVCPQCGDPNDFIIELDKDIEIKHLDDIEQYTWNITTKVGKVTYRLPTGAQQLAWFAQNFPIATRNTMMLADCVVSVNDEPLYDSRDWARNLNLADRKKILAAIDDNSPGPKFKGVKVSCATCQKEGVIEVDWTQLLFGQ